MEFGKIILGPENRGVDSKAAQTMATVGFSDFAELDIANHANAEIDLAAEFGTHKLFRGLKSASAVSGVVNVKTMYDHSQGYVSYPLAAGEKDLMLTPFTHIQKAGSISNVIVFWQEIG